jgi:uncharacterized membrane protein (DUF4010 family)
LIEQLYIRLAISLGIGLLIGAERERRKGAGPARASAGIRTFALASLAGGVSIAIGGELLLTAVALGIAGLSMLAYKRSSLDDPGLTSELALLTTTLLGALAVRDPVLGAGLAAIVAILLAGRNRIHRFVRDVLTEQELHDALLFAGASLVILPLTPDRPIGPFQVLNLRVIWTLAIMVMLISSVGYVALRTLGPRIGLPLTGLTSGFVSSVATIGAMGSRAAKEGRLLRPAVAGAVLSTLSTVVQMVVVLWVTDFSTLAALRTPLILAGMMASLYAALFIGRSLTHAADYPDQHRRAFSLMGAVAFALTVSAILFASAAIRQSAGSAGLIVAAGLAGFADTHAVAISTASLVAAGKIGAADAVPVILTGFTTNTVSKIVAATTTGGRQFAFAVIPGLIMVLAAAWLGTMAGF